VTPARARAHTHTHTHTHCVRVTTSFSVLLPLTLHKYTCRRPLGARTQESQAILGKDAIKLPSLGDPAGGPSSLFKSVLAGIGRTKQAARGHGGQGGASELDKDAGARTMGLQQDAHNFLVNREFLHATSMAHMLP